MIPEHLKTIYALIEKDGFSKFQEVLHRQSIADLFKNKTSASGLYVLCFSDNALYAGKTINFIHRFRTHFKNHEDIAYYSFRLLPDPQAQAVEEQKLIHKLEKSGLRLRNKEFTSFTEFSNEFDDICAVNLQKNWLELGSIEDQISRIQDSEQRYKYAQNYKKLTRESDFKKILPFLKRYIDVSIPMPKATEMSYWSVSAIPTPSNYVGKKKGQEMVRINIGSCETLTIGKNFTYQEAKGDIFFAFHGAYSPIASDLKNAQNYIKDKYNSVIIEHGYKALGYNQICHVSFSPETAAKILEDKKIQQSLRLANLSLMKKRSCLYSRYHCFDLADNFFA